MLRWRPRHRHPDREGLIDRSDSGLRGRSLRVARGSARRGAFVASALSAALLVSGCGGGGSGGEQAEPGPTTLTKADFIHRADEICQFYETRIEAAGDDLLAELPPSGKPTSAQLRGFARDVVVPNLELTIKGVGDLRPPASDEADVARILEQTATAVKQIKNDPVALAGGNPPALIEAGRLARRYGSNECGASDRAANLQDS